jgi:hypothetical protein
MPAGRGGGVADWPGPEFECDAAPGMGKGGWNGGMPRPPGTNVVIISSIRRYREHFFFFLSRFFVGHERRAYKVTRLVRLEAEYRMAVAFDQVVLRILSC